MKWNVFKTNPLLVKTYSDKLNIGKLLSKVLLNRDIKLKEAYNILKNPDALIEDPCLIYGATSVKDEIIKSIQSNSDIWIFADYDVDGLTAGYVMKDFLKQVCNNRVEIYYPERSEGYGLSIDFCSRLIEYYKDNSNKDNITVITVDNGITKTEETDLLKENNIKVIITDHHEPSSVLPKADAICDAFISKKSSGKHLCGAAIVWKICTLIAKELNKQSILSKYLPYIALATVADVMPMNKENIAIINKGLSILKDDTDIALNLKRLIRKSGINDISSKDLAWNIAPKINSCSRMNNLDVIQYFLFYDEYDTDFTLDEICLNIIEIDNERKELVKKAVQEAEKINYNNDKVCIFDSSKYNQGIAGIIAGKLVERHHKPAIVVHKDENGEYKGSVRSVSGLNIFELLTKEKDKKNIIDCGGHAEAAGVSFKEEQVDKLKSSLNSNIDNKAIEKEDIVDIDSYIYLTDINNINLTEINGLSYDKDNFKSPIFCLCNLNIIKTRTSSNNQNNVCFTFQDKDKVVRDYWGWGIGEIYKNIGSPKQVDVIGRMDYGFGNNASKATFIITDMRVCKECQSLSLI